MVLVEALDLFCGAGGLSLGLGAAGISVVAGVEWDEDAAATWANDHPGASVHQGDVNQVDWGRFDGVALVVGGPRASRGASVVFAEGRVTRGTGGPLSWRRSGTYVRGPSWPRTSPA